MMDAAISARELHKAYADKPVLKNLDWRIRPGSVVGLLGRNGAGKSTLLRCLLGLSRPDSGDVELLGEAPGNLSDAIRSRIGYVPQTSRDFGWMNVGDVLEYVGSFYPRWERARVSDLARRWDIDLRQQMGGLSEGERQKVAILRALGHRPDLLVLDEPVGSLDPITRREFIGELLEMTFDEGKTIVFSTHITSDLERIAADVALLKGGRIAYAGAIDAIKDRIVRLRITGPGADDVELSGVLSVRRGEDATIATLEGYNDELADRLGAQGHRVVLERLNLEEIFMELNR